MGKDGFMDSDACENAARKVCEGYLELVTQIDDSEMTEMTAYLTRLHLTNTLQGGISYRYKPFPEEAINKFHKVWKSYAQKFRELAREQKSRGY
ncbi:MAG: hypothetical protein KKC19_01645 [Nanoarchaeota archaeon]|nr:hypothetical protein [Nanoarchaeota archaeon]